MIRHALTQVHGAGGPQQGGAPAGAGQPQRVRAAPQHRAAAGAAPASHHACTCLLNVHCWIGCISQPPMPSMIAPVRALSCRTSHCSHSIASAAWHVHAAGCHWRRTQHARQSPETPVGITVAQEVFLTQHHLGDRDGVCGRRRPGAVRPGASPARGARRPPASDDKLQLVYFRSCDLWWKTSFAQRVPSAMLCWQWSCRSHPSSMCTSEKRLGRKFHQRSSDQCREH